MAPLVSRNIRFLWGSVDKARVCSALVKHSGDVHRLNASLGPFSLRTIMFTVPSSRVVRVGANDYYICPLDFSHAVALDNRYRL